MKLKHYILLSIIPLSEIKAIFYNSDKKVSWFFFSNDKRYLCNVLEDYSNIIIFGIIFYFLSKKTDASTQNIAKFLLVLTALDLFHLGLMDMQFFIIIKLVLAFIICRLLKIFSIY